MCECVENCATARDIQERKKARARMRDKGSVIEICVKYVFASIESYSEGENLHGKIIRTGEKFCPMVCAVREIHTHAHIHTYTHTEACAKLTKSHSLDEKRKRNVDLRAIARGYFPNQSEDEKNSYKLARIRQRRAFRASRNSIFVSIFL